MPSLWINSLIFLIFTSCTVALDKEQIRKGNHKAPPELQVAEECNSSNTEDCKVVISHPTDE